jgi:hypothetical protein
MRSEVGEGSGSVALEREAVFAGLEDRFDALADRGEVQLVVGLVLAGGPEQERPSSVTWCSNSRLA